MTNATLALSMNHDRNIHICQSMAIATSIPSKMTI